LSIFGVCDPSRKRIDNLNSRCFVSVSVVSSVSPVRSVACRPHRYASDNAFANPYRRRPSSTRRARPSRYPSQKASSASCAVRPCLPSASPSSLDAVVAYSDRDDCNRRRSLPRSKYFFSA
jgi:hypothetical protein